jgi:hypothetical protein
MNQRRSCAVLNAQAGADALKPETTNGGPNRYSEMNAFESIVKITASQAF